MWGTIGKNLKKIIITFQKKKVNFFFKFFPMVPHMEFLFALWYPKGSKKIWPNCHSGQSVSGQSVTSQSDTDWLNCLSGQTVSGQTVLFQNVTLAKMSFCPDQSVSGQSVILAKVWFSPLYISIKTVLWHSDSSHSAISLNLEPRLKVLIFIHVVQKLIFFVNSLFSNSVSIFDELSAVKITKYSWFLDKYPIF